MGVRHWYRWSAGPEEVGAPISFWAAVVAVVQF